MKNQRMSLEEFKEIFRDSFESEEELLREYKSLLAVLEQLDRSIVPDLSSSQKELIFKQSWWERRQEPSWILTWLYLFRKPTVAFVLGIVIGCIVMSVVTNNRLYLTQTVSAEPLLTVEHTKYTQTYKGRIIDEFYPQFENPKIVLEKAEESAPTQRALYGTLDNGEVYVVWNL
jgi:uncharacterized membrane-anchored protein YhcB (DUF1043 family)